MVLKLYGHIFSTCTKRVALVLHEKKVPFQFVPVDLAKGEHKIPSYISKQPFGQVPYIDDDGFILYESRAIARYIARKYENQGTPLIPSEPKANALFEQAAAIEAFSFDGPAWRCIFEKWTKPTFKLGETNMEVFNSSLALLDSRLAVYNKILEKQKFVSGDDITLADLFHVPFAVLLPKTGTDVMTKYPNVDRWIKDLISRKAWQDINDGIQSVDSY